MRRTVGEPGMPLHGKWLGPGALGRSASIRAGIVWASFKDCTPSAFPSISKNTGQEFHGTAYHDPEDKTRRYNKQSYGRCQAWGHDFLGHRFGWGPHRFACLSHPCRVSGPFLINLIVLNSDGGSYVSTCFLLRKNNQMRNEEMCCDDGIMSQGANEDALNLVKDHAYRPTAAPSCYG